MTQTVELAQRTRQRTQGRRWSILRALRWAWPHRARQAEPLPASLLHDLGLHAEHHPVPLPLHHTDPLLWRR